MLIMEQPQSLTLEDVRQRMEAFVNEREWQRFHTPRNILLALTGEVGELCELFQWKGEVPVGLPDWSEEDKKKLGDELADVLLYLCRLSDVCGINLSAAALRKLAINARKYPADQAKGKAAKYTAYVKDAAQLSQIEQEVDRTLLSPSAAHAGASNPTLEESRPASEPAAEHAIAHVNSTGSTFTAAAGGRVVASILPPAEKVPQIVGAATLALAACSAVFWVATRSR